MNRFAWSPRRLVALFASSLMLSVIGPWGGFSSPAVASTKVCPSGGSCTNYAPTVGVSDASEPSSLAPPLATALSGYTRSYITDFTGSTLPPGWSKFNGVPGGDPGTHFIPSQVSVANGELQLTAAYSSSSREWITGGTCLCTLSHTYGAYFVRSRVTGPGPTVVELLWPAGGYPWPPEVDFNETNGATTSTMATVHYQTSNQFDHRTTQIDMTQWHTWGVIWSPQSITYVVDGRVWGVVSVSSEIPHIPMTLDIQQQTWCSQGSACPTSSQSTLVDWATEYTPTSSVSVTAAAPPTTIPISAGISPTILSTVVQGAAATVYRRHAHTVIVTASRTSSRHQDLASRTARVQEIVSMLKNDLHSLGASAPQILVHWSKRAIRSRSSLDLLLTLLP